MRSFTFLATRYTLASAIALVIDYLTAWACSQFGLSVPYAASIGYVTGLVIVYPIMRFFVFTGSFGGIRTAVLFLLSGGIGIAVTFSVSSFVNGFLGLGFHESKIAAAGVSFITVFIFRKLHVFIPKPQNKHRKSR